MKTVKIVILAALVGITGQAMANSDAANKALAALYDPSSFQSIVETNTDIINESITSNGLTLSLLGHAKIKLNDIKNNLFKLGCKAPYTSSICKQTYDASQALQLNIDYLTSKGAK